MIRVRATSAAGLAEIGGASLLVPGPRLDLSAGSGVTFTDSGSTRTIAASASASPSFDGWNDDTSETWTYSSFTAGPPAVGVFTVTGDVTAKYTPGTKIKMTQTTVKYFVVKSSSVSAGTTSVSITGGVDYTLANAAISSNYHSYVQNPQGWPGWFAFSAATTGDDGSGTSVARFQANARHIICAIDITGVSTATTKVITLPITPANITNMQWVGHLTVKNNNTTLTTPGEIVVNPSNNSASMFTNTAAAAWTAVNAWFAIGVFHYEI